MNLVDDLSRSDPRVQARPPRGPQVGRQQRQPGHLHRHVPDSRELTHGSGPLEEVLAVDPLVPKALRRLPTPETGTVITDPR